MNNSLHSLAHSAVDGNLGKCEYGGGTEFCTTVKIVLALEECGLCGSSDSV